MEMDAYSASEKPSPDERERLVRSFGTWLDNALADEARYKPAIRFRPSLEIAISILCGPP
jgi:hypothetical protein